jgi:hypothetical protein
MKDEVGDNLNAHAPAGGICDEILVLTTQGQIGLKDADGMLRTLQQPSQGTL